MTQSDAPTPTPSAPSAAAWDEENSARFLDLGLIYTPRRAEIVQALLDLIPAERDDAFTGVELACGAGWLSAAILDHYPRVRMRALDASEAMRTATAERLRPFDGRGEVDAFLMEADEWRTELPSNLTLVVSSLAVHHLDGPGKRQLFADIYQRLQPGGALLLFDLVEPTGSWGRSHMARAWDAEVARQSVEFTGDLTAHEHFVADEWNYYRYPPPPDDIDHPSGLFEQLRWLHDAGYRQVDAWWVRAGHALYGGYR